MTKKSWFGALMGSDREEFHFLTGQDKTLSQIKADIVHAFLSVSIQMQKIQKNGSDMVEIYTFNG